MIEQIKNVLLEKLGLQEAYVSSDDGSHFQIIVVGEQFASMSKVKQQQTVYAPLMDYITSNQVHAVSIKVYTPEQWRRERKLLGL